MTTVERTENDWCHERRMTRIYTQGGPIDSIAYPSPEEQPCVDGACDVWACKRAHGTWLLEALGCTISTSEEARDSFRRTPEADHRAFKRACRAGIAAERGVLLEALQAQGYQPEAIRYARTAGCSCGCSPAWIATSPSMRGYDLHVDLRSDAKREADSERSAQAREAHELYQAYATTWREEDAMV